MAPEETQPAAASSCKKPTKPHAIPVKKDPAPKVVLEPAYFDFAAHVAFTYHLGVKFTSTDWFPSRPELGDRSPLHCRFSLGNGVVSRHVHGIWPGALKIGVAATTAPVVRLWGKASG
jgi:hypothetical protein